MTEPVVLITGGAIRVGATIAEHLHAAGFRMIIHYRSSTAAARDLSDRLNTERPDSCRLIGCDLNVVSDWQGFAAECRQHFGRIDVVINNASAFYSTPFGSVTAEQWDDLLNANLRAPFFLCQALRDDLLRQNGSIINIVDVYAQRPLQRFPVYSIAKAGLAMLTRALAIELAPEVRVNGIAPGVVLWPEDMSQQAQQRILDQVPMHRAGTPEDIARTSLFLCRDAPYITGQIISVDGGQTV